MWGGLLTFIAAIFHAAVLGSGAANYYMAGVPKALLDNVPIAEWAWIVIITFFLFLLSSYAFRLSTRWPDIRSHRKWLILLAAVFLIWGIAGAPVSHLNDWSHGYSIFHVGAVFLITLTGLCFAVAGWALKQS